MSAYEKTKPDMLDKVMKTTTITGYLIVYLQEKLHAEIPVNINFVYSICHCFTERPDLYSIRQTSE